MKLFKHPLVGLTLCVQMALSLGLASAQTATIDSIEINQAIGKQLNGALNFVAGKSTAVRAFLTSDVTVDPSQSKVLIRKDGQDVATISPRSYDTPTRVVDFLCPSMDRSEEHTSELQSPCNLVC